MSAELIAVIGCPACKVDLFNLRAAKVEGQSARQNQLEKIGGQETDDYLVHHACGTNLERKPANGWS